MSEFKKGDRVECIDNSGSFALARLDLGRIYTVDQIRCCGTQFELKETSSITPNIHRFKLVATKPQTTKENNMDLNSSIRTVLVEENKAEFEFVEKFQKTFGKEIAENFTGAMILRANMKLYVAEINRLDDIEAKRLEKEEKDK